MNKITSVALAIAAAAALSAATGHAQPYGPGMGPGMMGGWGPGGGMDPGMMGGWGGGPPGMMGGWGGGHGMMGGWGYVPDLTSEQREKIAQAQQEYWRKQSPLMQQMHSQMWNAEKPGAFDEQAARQNYDAVASLHKQMFENSLELRKRIDGVLTPQQREALRQGWQR